MHASVQKTTSVDKFDIQLPRLAKFIHVWRKRSTFTLIDVPYCVSQSLTNSQDSQALQTLQRQYCHYPAASYLIRPARLVQHVRSVLEGTAGCSSWSPPQFSPLCLYFCSYSIVMGHFAVHAAIKAGIHHLNLKETGIKAASVSNRTSPSSHLIFLLP